GRLLRGGAGLLDPDPDGGRAGRSRARQRHAGTRIRARRTRRQGREGRPEDRLSDDQPRAGERAPSGRRGLRHADRHPVVRKAVRLRHEHWSAADRIRGFRDDHRDVRPRLLGERVWRESPPVLLRPAARRKEVPVRDGPVRADRPGHPGDPRFLRVDVQPEVKEPAPASETSPSRSGFVRRFLSVLGPGVITGAADDDPSGIATYSVAGARLGTSLLWTAILTWPLMAAVQMMCARIGMVTGRGLAGALRRKFPRPLLVAAALALLAANTINIGADLSGMADAAEMLTGWNSHFFVVLFGVGIAWAIIRFRYHQIATVLKWLALVL